MGHYLRLAEANARQGDYAGAIAHLRKAIALQPSRPQPYLRLAVLFAELKRYGSAQETLNALLTVHKDYPEAYGLLGRIAAEQERYADAEQHFRRYLDLRPGDPVGLAELAAALLLQTKDSEAEPLLRQALEKDPNLGTAHYNLGMLASGRQDLAAARSHLQAAARLLGTRDAHFQLGIVLVQLGEFTPAEAAFRQALALDRDFVEGYYRLSALLRRMGRVEEADRMLEDHKRLSSEATARRQREKRVAALHNEVVSFLQQDRLPQAEEKLAEILALDPEDDLARYRSAQIYFLRRDFTRALETIRFALARKEFEPAYHHLAAMCLERLDRKAEAVAAYERVVELSDYADGHAALARVALQAGDFTGAVVHLRRAVDIEPENPDWRFALAEALEQAGAREEAQQQRAKGESLRQGKPGS